MVCRMACRRGSLPVSRIESPHCTDALSRCVEWRCRVCAAVRGCVFGWNKASRGMRRLLASCSAQDRPLRSAVLAWKRSLHRIAEPFGTLRWLSHIGASLALFIFPQVTRIGAPKRPGRVKNALSVEPGHCRRPARVRPVLHHQAGLELIVAHPCGRSLRCACRRLRRVRRIDPCRSAWTAAHTAHAARA